MLKHFKKVWGKEAHIVLDWFAFIIQYPEKKMRWGIVTKSVQGVGKSLIANFIFKPLLHESNFRSITKKDLEDNFNTWIENQLLLIEEIQQVKEEDIKILIGNDSISVRGMHKESVELANPCAVMGFTNSEFSITHMGQDSRRLFITRSEARKMTSDESTELIAWLKANPKQMLQFFKTRDLSEFDPYTRPDNEYTKQMIRDSFPWPRNIIRDLISEDGELHNVPVCSYRYLMAEIKANSHGNQLQTRAETMHNTTGSKILEEMGFRRLGKFTISKSLEVAYITPWGVELGDNYTTTIVRECINNHNYPSEWVN